MPSQHHTVQGASWRTNALIKNVKRIATGFRNFTHYRLRVLPHTDNCNCALLGT